MRRNLLLGIVSLALCTGLAMAADLEVMIYDHNGSLVMDTFVLVTDTSGRTVAKLQPAADGVYGLDPALMGQKVVFKINDPALFANTMDARIPEYVQGPVVITLPAPPAQTQQVPANDTCDTAIDVGVLPAFVAGSSVGATLTGEPDCDTPNTAGGVWYSVVGTGNPITATTCELETPPGTADYDTKISVYCLGCGPDAQCVAGNDDTAGGDFCGFTFHSTVTWASEAGVLYSILVHGFSTGQGGFEMSVSEGGSPTSPPVSCLPPVPSGACCVQECNDPVLGFCADTTADECLALGGEYQGDDVGCAVPNGTTLSLNNATPVAIPDGTSEFVCSTIDVVDPVMCDSIVDLDVGVMLTHTWIGDTNVEITSPGGATTNMWQNRCGSTVNMDFFFDDEGTDTSCAVVAAPGVGRGQPTVAGLGPAFSQYDGTNPAGTWELCVNDTFPADSGTLDNWVLEIDCGSATCVFDPGDPGDPGGKGKGKKGDSTDLLGIEAFGDLSNGSPLEPVFNSGPDTRTDLGTNRGPSRVPASRRLPR